MRLLLCALSLCLLQAVSLSAESIPLKLRYQEPVQEGVQNYHRLERDESWEANQTAIILCDVWDSHTCANAVLRLEEFVPRLNETVNRLRKQGAVVIHAPSGCMDHYSSHPARKRAESCPVAAQLPAEIGKWCYQIPSEEQGTYPIDQTDGGNDDTAEQKEKWLQHLQAEGRNPKSPWQKQHTGIRIDDAQDYISDRGEEVWSILEQHQIRNVILAGVHTNMCVLGRPFGLRQLARNGKNVVLMRDLTDTMYNPASSPFVSHYTGTDLIISHIERHVCPTISSDQILGGKPFRFQNDHRRDLLIVIAEDEYKTEQSLPVFALEKLGHDYRVSIVYGTESDRNLIPGIEQIRDADVALISVRRRVLPPAQMQAVRDYVSSGRPLIGIRTASHAFSLRAGTELPEGYADWTSFDQDVFGGNYHGHHGNKLKSTVRYAQNIQHPILKGLDTSTTFPQGWSLYEVSPLLDGTTPLLFAAIEGLPEEPVAWTFQRKDGGRSFYTSLGNVDDFQRPELPTLLKNGIDWAAGAIEE